MTPTVFILYGPPPVDEQLPVYNVECTKFCDKALAERRLENTIKHMSLAQKIVLKNLGQQEASALSTEIYEYAFGHETNTGIWENPDRNGCPLWRFFPLPVFKKK